MTVLLIKKCLTGGETKKHFFFFLLSQTPDLTGNTELYF